MCYSYDNTLINIYMKWQYYQAYIYIYIDIYISIYMLAVVIEN